MEAYLIEINGVPVQLLGPLPSVITSLDIEVFINVRFEHGMVLHIKDWLNKIMQGLDCEYVTYQKVIIPANELKKF